MEPKPQARNDDEDEGCEGEEEEDDEGAEDEPVADEGFWLASCWVRKW